MSYMSPLHSEPEAPNFLVTSVNKKSDERHIKDSMFKSWWHWIKKKSWMPKQDPMEFGM